MREYSGSQDIYHKIHLIFERKFSDFLRIVHHNRQAKIEMLLIVEHNLSTVPQTHHGIDLVLLKVTCLNLDDHYH